jgi:hypothetical protein
LYNVTNNSGRVAIIEDKSFVAERRILYDWSSSSDHLKRSEQRTGLYLAINLLIEVSLILVILVQHLFIVVVSASGIILDGN